MRLDLGGGGLGGEGQGEGISEHGWLALELTLCRRSQLLQVKGHVGSHVLHIARTLSKNSANVMKTNKRLFL